MVINLLRRLLGTRQIDLELGRIKKRVLAIDEELLWAHRFRDSIIDIDWIKHKNFSASGAAANYSFLYILFKILELTGPKKIIEFGIGQSSKITSQYVAYGNTNASLLLIESDFNWICIYRHIVELASNIKIMQLNTVNKDVNTHSTLVYQDLLEKIGDEKFNLIISDGPCGSERFSRVGVCDLIDHNLADDFIVVFDDYDRQGERDTVELFKQKLGAKNIDYDTFSVHGIKVQCVVCSKKFAFLRTI